jgi:hypothetical protein
MNLTEMQTTVAENEEVHMKIGLVDVDGHNFPNIPLMKLVYFHKQKGDSVKWAMPIEYVAVIRHPESLRLDTCGGEVRQLRRTG